MPVPSENEVTLRLFLTVSEPQLWSSAYLASLCGPGDRAPVGVAAIAPVPPGELPLCWPSLSRAEQQGRQMGGGSGYPRCC